jgi:hypothetical protein
MSLSDRDKLILPIITTEDFYHRLITYLTGMVNELDSRVGSAAVAALLDPDQVRRGLVLYGERRGLTELIDQLKKLRGDG